MKKHAIVTLLLLSLVFVTGCWNSRELKDLAIVIGIGIDHIPDSDQYRVSFQIVNPRAGAGGKTSGGGANELPSVVFTSVDRSLFSALRKTTQKVPRQLFFAHSQLLVLGESLAREGIKELFDFYERSHELRLNTSVVIARGTTAESVLKVLTPLSPTSATSITGRLKVSSAVWAQNVNEDISSVIQKLGNGGTPLMSGVKISGDAPEGRKKSNLDQSTPPVTIELKGIALFSDGKLASWADGSTARGVIWVLNEMKSTNVDITCEDGKEGVSIEIIRSASKVRAHRKEGKLSFTIDVQEEGSLSEAQCPMDPGSHEVMEKLRKKVADETKREISLALKAAQSKKSDIFGFAQEVKRSYPKEWKRVEKDWPEVFAASDVTVNVEAYVRRTGMRGKSYIKPAKEE